MLHRCSIRSSRRSTGRWTLILAGALVGAIMSSFFVQHRRASASYSYETTAQYVQDLAGDKAYQDTKVQIGTWQSAFGLYTLPVDTIATWTNIMVTSYSFDNQVFYRATPGRPDEFFYVANLLTYSNTPSYITRGYYDFWDSAYDVVLSSGDCQSGGECLGRMGAAYSEVTVPYRSNSPYTSDWGQYTTYP